MPSSPAWPPELTEQLGPLVPVGPVASSAWRVRSPSGDVVIKQGPSVADEAAGLEQLGGCGSGLRIPAVLFHSSVAQVMAVEWIDTESATSVAEDRLGAGLAALHGVPSSAWGGGSGWIGDCQIDPAPVGSAAAFYAHRLSGLARRGGVPLVDDLAFRLADLLPPSDGPSLLHGDLWWGNVLWGRGQVPALIDPSVHGGHPEEDLAMLALFGPVPDRVLPAYQSVRPLPADWEERVRLWQIYPLLVHAVLFGGSYRSSTRDAAARYGLLAQGR